MTYDMGPPSFTGSSGPVTKDHLQLLGKQAAQLAESGGLCLTDSVVHTLNAEGLNPNQVQRVVEFANTEAFQQKFASLDPAMRVVDIDGGPADPQRVLQSLNDTARPQDVTMDSLDYLLSPHEKTSSTPLSPYEPTFRTVEGVQGDVLRLQQKLAAAQDELVASTESSKFQMMEALDELAGVVKTASLDGACHEDLVNAWCEIDSELVGSTLARMPELETRYGVKVASQINPAHPVVTKYASFVKHAHQYHTYALAQRNVERRLMEVTSMLGAAHAGH